MSPLLAVVYRSGPYTPPDPAEEAVDLGLSGSFSSPWLERALHEVTRIRIDVEVGDPGSCPAPNWAAKRVYIQTSDENPVR